MLSKVLLFVTGLGLACGQLLTGAYPGHSVPAAVTSQSGNILRSYGNLGQVSTQTKTIDTPYSSVSKSDIRVSNPGFPATTYVSPAPVHEAPVFHHPLVPSVATVPTAYHAAAPATIHGQPLLGVAFSAAPAVSHMSFDGYGIQYTY